MSFRYGFNKKQQNKTLEMNLEIALVEISKPKRKINLEMA